MQALGTEAGNRCFIEVSSARNRPNNVKAGRGCLNPSPSSGATSSRSPCTSPVGSAPTSPRQSHRKSNGVIRSFELSNVPDNILGLLGDNVPINSEEKLGLLFTDAAHTVLLDFDP